MSSVLEAVRITLQRLDVLQGEVCVGLSGGVDSVTLLDVLQQLAPEHKLRLSALHVNHGLSPQASQWEQFCQQLCEGRGIALLCVQVTVARDSKLGLEAAARNARYAAFAQSRAEYVALAHHLDDQIETFLIQLLRGAGARGLSAMPTVSMDEVRRMKNGGKEQGNVDHPRLLRPLLGVARAQIEEYAKARGLKWIEDETNLDPALDRNFLRHEVLPLIASRFPGYRQTLARAAQNLAAAAALADFLAEIDSQAVCDEDGFDADALRALPAVRALNVLRHAFDRKGLPMPPRSRLEEALRQCMEAAPDAQVRIAFGAYSIRRHRNRITLAEDGGDVGDWREPWRGEDCLDLPAGLGRLRFIRCTGEGISRSRLDSAPVRVAFRRGGEKLSPGPGRPRRRLKHLLQEAGVPAWERGRVPLLFCGETLAWVAGIGVAAECRARAGEPSVRIEWERAGTQNLAC